MEFIFLIQIFSGIALIAGGSAVALNGTLIMGEEIHTLKANMRVMTGTNIFLL